MPLNAINPPRTTPADATAPMGAKPEVGPLRVTIGRDPVRPQALRVSLGRATEWFALPIDDAVKFALAILDAAHVDRDGKPNRPLTAAAADIEDGRRLRG